jgi:catechol 2,3-dioxygenase-like lactoylglutathione lyase family enzyme
MLIAIHPKLPMRNKAITKDFYVNQLGFKLLGSIDFADYLMVEKDGIQIHFFSFRELDVHINYGQVYIRTNAIHELFEEVKAKNLLFHPDHHLQNKPWGQIEFSVLDPDHNLLTFGQNMAD